TAHLSRRRRAVPPARRPPRVPGRGAAAVAAGGRRAGQLPGPPRRLLRRPGGARMMADRTPTDLLAAQPQGESAESITRAALDAIRARDPHIGAFLYVDESAALEQAR